MGEEEKAGFDFSAVSPAMVSHSWVNVHDESLHYLK